MLSPRLLERLTARRGRARRLLAVFPHPDDEAYGSAGALARVSADPDGSAVLLCLTRGEASSLATGMGLDSEGMGNLRAERLREVEGILGLDALILPGLPDGRLARVPVPEAAAPIRQVLQAFRPQVVIGHDPRGVNAHPDHIASHWAIRHALLDAPPTRFAMVVYRQADCDAVKPRLLFPTSDEEIDAVLSLSEDEVVKKEACLRVHDALVTLLPDGDPRLLLRPPEERYDFLGEDLEMPVNDLFTGRKPIVDQRRR